jgi:hypothetical protein
MEPGPEPPPLPFDVSVVSRTDDGKITIVLFDGTPEPSCLGIFECTREVGISLWINLRSALKAPD